MGAGSTPLTECRFNMCISPVHIMEHHWEVSDQAEVTQSRNMLQTQTMQIDSG